MNKKRTQFLNEFTYEKGFQRSGKTAKLTMGQMLKKELDECLRPLRNQKIYQKRLLSMNIKTEPPQRIKEKAHSMLFINYNMFGVNSNQTRRRSFECDTYGRKSRKEQKLSITAPKTYIFEHINQEFMKAEKERIKKLAQSRNRKSTRHLKIKNDDVKSSQNKPSIFKRDSQQTILVEQPSQTIIQFGLIEEKKEKETAPPLKSIDFPVETIDKDSFIAWSDTEKKTKKKDRSKHAKTVIINKANQSPKLRRKQSKLGDDLPSKIQALLYKYKNGLWKKKNLGSKDDIDFHYANYKAPIESETKISLKMQPQMQRSILKVSKFAKLPSKGSQLSIELMSPSSVIDSQTESQEDEISIEMFKTKRDQKKNKYKSILRHQRESLDIIIQSKNLRVNETVKKYITSNTKTQNMKLHLHSQQGSGVLQPDLFQQDYPIFSYNTSRGLNSTKSNRTNTGVSSPRFLFTSISNRKLNTDILNKNLKRIYEDQSYKNKLQNFRIKSQQTPIKQTPPVSPKNQLLHPLYRMFK